MSDVSYFFNTNVEFDREKSFLENEYGYTRLTSILKLNTNMDIHVDSKTNTDTECFIYFNIRIHPYQQTASNINSLSISSNYLQ